FPWWQQLLIILCTQIIFFWVFHTYSGILRFSTFIDIIKVIFSVFLTVAIWASINLIVASNGTHLFFNSILYAYFFVAIVLLTTTRISIKTIFEFLSHNITRTPVLIYGVQSMGLAVAKMLQTSLDAKYRAAGFISDDNNDTHHNLQGLPVYHRDEHLFELMDQRGISHVIVSPAILRSGVPLTILNTFLEHNITLLTAPNITDLQQESDSKDVNIAKVTSIEAIRVEDLLERPVISINTANIQAMMQNKVILITGAAGSIGSEIVRQVAHYNPSLIVLFEIAESPLHNLSLDLRSEFPQLHFTRIIGDVRNIQILEQVFSEYHPQIVFHAAAYKHVPLMEDFPSQAVLANVLGTKNVADMAVKYNAERFVMISTDKAVNPTNVMGASKRIAEIYVQSLNNHLQALHPSEPTTRFITTRFGNVLGSNGSVVPYFKKQIAAGGPVTVTHPDIIRYFMTISEASCLVLEAATLGAGGEIFCFDMGHPVKIADLAKNMIRLAGFVPGKDIKIEYTGLRPGEKLYEELLNQRETTLPTPNEKIKIAKVRESDYNSILPAINDLIQEARTGAVFPTVKKMKQIVPEYISHNTIYEQLDQPSPGINKTL
ncbi:MAG: polysaccharide biosynthesis protein, partial [Paludibacteraceae bacterium]|nr:polysaccharide biosynthesis protein [Paludibacteraceae bacterium]